MPSSKSFRLIQFVGDAIKQVLQTYSVCEWWHQASPSDLFSLWVMLSSKSLRLIQFVSDVVKQVLQTNSVCEWCRQASPSDMASLTNWISLKDLLDGITHKLNKSERLAWWHHPQTELVWMTCLMASPTNCAIKQVFQTYSVCEWCHQASPSD
jgi:hypothetical protein